MREPEFQILTGEEADVIDLAVGEALEDVVVGAVEEAAEFAQLQDEAVDPVLHLLAVADHDVGVHLGVAGDQTGEVAVGGAGHLAEVPPALAAAQHGEEAGGDGDGEMRDGGGVVVMLLGGHEMFFRADHLGEAQHGADRCLAGGVAGDDGPGAVLEKTGLGVLHARVGLACHRVAADVGDVRGQVLAGPDHGHDLGRGDVGDGGAGAEGGGDVFEDFGKRSGWGGDHDQAGPLHGFAGVAFFVIDGAHFFGEFAGAAHGVGADDLEVLGALFFHGEGQRSADQTQPDNCDTRHADSWAGAGSLPHRGPLCRPLVRA